MSNKRNLKKHIRYICGEIALEAIMTREFVENADMAMLNDVVVRLADLQEHSLKNATFAFEKTPRDFDSKAAYNKAARTYFRKAYKTFYEKFNLQIEEIVKSLNKAIPEAQRNINKEIANK